MFKTSDTFIKVKKLSLEMEKGFEGHTSVYHNNKFILIGGTVGNFDLN